MTAETLDKAKRLQGKKDNRQKALEAAEKGTYRFAGESGGGYYISDFVPPEVFEAIRCMVVSCIKKVIDDIDKEYDAL